MILEAIIYACLLLLGITFLSKKLRQGGNGRTLPSPKGYPLVGSVFDVKPETMHLKFDEYVADFGDIFQVKILNNTIVSINNADLIRKAFSEEPYRQTLNDRDYFYFADLILYGGQTTGAYRYSNDVIHSGLRKGVTKAIHMYGDGVKKFEDRETSELDRLVREVDSYHGNEFNFETILKRSLSNLISILMIGEGVAEEDIDIFSRYDKATDFFVNPRANMMMSTFPFLRFIPGTYKRHFDNVVAARDDIKKKYVDDIIATYKPGTIRGTMDSMYSQKLEDIAAGRTVIYTYERMVCAAADIVVAGITTSLSTLCNLMVCLLHHPQYQDKIQRELDSVVGRDRNPVLADKAKCPWVEAVLLESARMIPTLPLLCPHTAREDTVFEGYTIPKGATVLGNVWSIGHDEDIWGDPWTFRPERFLDDSGQILPPENTLRKNVLPFSTGRRHCIGEAFSRSRMFLYVATMLQRWTFVPIAGKVVSWDPRKSENFEVRLMICAKEFYCRVEERK